MTHIHETCEFRTKMQQIDKINQLSAKPQRRHSLPDIVPSNNAVKFEINMADDERSSVDGSSLSLSHGHAPGGDAGNGPVGDAAAAEDGHLNNRRRPFLIGVAGGTASGKVRTNSHMVVFCETGVTDTSPHWHMIF